MNQKEIEAGLRELGLRQGDIVLLHSSLSSLGYVEGGAETLVDAFLTVLTKEGTLVVPTFGALGVVTAVVRSRPEAVSSIHPLASVAAIGARAEEICRDHWKAELAHGEDTPYARITALGGYVCLLGVDQDRSTMLHAAEAALRLPYPQKTSEKTFTTPEGEVTKSWPYFPGPHRDFIGLDKLLRESGRMKIGRLGTSVVRLIKAADLMELRVEAGKRDPYFVLCDNPACADCVTQRAGLRRDRLGREAFKLATSACLAGRYLPEIAENCRAAGLEVVVLDALEGKPIQSLPEKKLRAAIDELRGESLRVCALRLSAITAKTEAVLHLAAEAGLRRLVLPLSPGAGELLRAAEGSGLTLSFYNAHLDGQKASDALLKLKQAGLNPGFTFNVANFARAGQMPFLKSYKAKLHRFVDQLDVEDCTFAGEPRALARGNAEIKRR